MQTLMQKVDVEAPQLLEHKNLLKTCTLNTKVRQKYVPLSRTSESKRQKRVPFIRKCVENANPRAENTCAVRLLRLSALVHGPPNPLGWLTKREPC